MKRTQRLASTALALAAALAVADQARAAEQCYDFSRLKVGTTYQIGDPVDAQHATITFRPYKVNGSDFGGASSGAEVAQAQIAGGSAPEMAMKTLAFQIEPKKPVTRLRMRLAQNITPTGGFGVANVEINGERHESPDGFAAVDGKRLGGAQMRASLANDAANWQVGTLEIRAKPGGTLKSVTIGGHTYRVDNVCLGN